VRCPNNILFFNKADCTVAGCVWVTVGHLMIAKLGNAIACNTIPNSLPHAAQKFLYTDSKTKHAIVDNIQ